MRFMLCVSSPSMGKTPSNEIGIDIEYASGSNCLVLVLLIFKRRKIPCFEKFSKQFKNYSVFFLILQREKWRRRDQEETRLRQTTQGA